MAASAQSYLLHSLPFTHTRKLICFSTVASYNISGRKLRPAVIGGGIAGSSATEALASGEIETFLFERSPSGAKPCGGAIPLRMLDEFDILIDLVDRNEKNLTVAEKGFSRIYNGSGSSSSSNGHCSPLLSLDICL